MACGCIHRHHTPLLSVAPKLDFRCCSSLDRTRSRLFSSSAGHPFCLGDGEMARVGILGFLTTLFLILAAGLGPAQAVFASRTIGASIFAVGHLFAASLEILLVEGAAAGEKAASGVGRQVAVVSFVISYRGKILRGEILGTGYI